MMYSALPARARGFTLLEMMVVVTIIAILAAIALPMYGSYIEKGQLADAKTAATALRVSFEAERLERPRDFRKAADFQSGYTRAYTRSVPANVSKLYKFNVRYLPDAKAPNGFAIDILPTTRGKKYGLQMNMAGDIQRCTVSGNSLTNCEKF